MARLYAEVARQAVVERGAINFNEVDLGKLGEDVQGAVCRAAVDDDDLVDGDGLLEDALYALTDALGLVPDRDDDGNCWEGHQTSFCQAGWHVLGHFDVAEFLSLTWSFGLGVGDHAADAIAQCDVLDEIAEVFVHLFVAGIGVHDLIARLEELQLLSGVEFFANDGGQFLHRCMACPLRC